MRYYNITDDERGHVKYLCTQCAGSACVQATGYDIVEHRHNLDRDLVEQNVGTWCDACNAPLDTPDDDYKREVTTVTFALHGYSAAPLSFRRISRRQLARIVSEMADGGKDASATTEWSRAALDCDRECAAWAQQQPGPILFAQDEDGYYFAAARKAA